DRAVIDVSQSDSTRAVDTAVRCHRLSFMADDGADRSRANTVVEEPGVCAGSACDWRFENTNYFPSPGSEYARTGDRLRDAVVSGVRRAGAALFVGKSRG